MDAEEPLMPRHLEDAMCNWLNADESQEYEARCKLLDAWRAEHKQLKRELAAEKAKGERLREALQEMVSRWEPDGGADKRLWDRAVAALESP